MQHFNLWGEKKITQSTGVQTPAVSHEIKTKKNK